MPDFVRPLFELCIVGHTSLKRDGIVLCTPWRFAAAARIAAIAVFYYLRSTFQRTHLADPRNVFSVPLNFELEVLVRVEALRLCIHAKLGHNSSPSLLSVLPMALCIYCYVLSRDEQ